MKTIISISLIFLSFFSFFFDTKNEKHRITGEIVNKVVKNLEKKYGLKDIGRSVSSPDGIYQELGIIFIVNNELDKNEGRKLIINALDEFLLIVNSESNFKKYMIQFPFTLENIHISIIAMGFDGKGVYYPKISTFSSCNDLFFYKTEIKGVGPYYTKEYETFIDAKKLWSIKKRIITIKVKTDS